MPSQDFYAEVPVFRGFASLMDPGLYRPVPDDWLIGLADVVRSTEAIAAGGYRVVNMAGAAVIAAVRNALPGRDFPFVFGGDGASFAVGPEARAAAQEALAATAAFARDDLGLDLRVALMPVSVVRAAGHDLRVARYAPSPHVAYAMFAGGGLAYAEAEMKQGAHAIAPAPAGTRPDLTGLTCRWDEAPARNGVILSLLVMPGPAGDPEAFRALVEEVVGLAEASPEVSRPMPESSMSVRWPPPGLGLEALASRRPGERAFLRRLSLLARTFASFLIFRTGVTVGGFAPETYKRESVENSDFRKFDDGLRMTLDCTPAFADRLEERLARAETEGVARHGVHRQNAAVMTCITPNPLVSDHVHFIDGAAGGYASAARRLKAP